MPLVPTTLERLVVLRLNQGPGPLLDLLGPISFRTVTAALRLGVFDTLASAPATAPELAAQIDCDQRGTTLLVDALATIGYVRQRGDRYELSAMSAKWLPLLRDGMPFGERMVREWDHLEECVRDPGSWRDDKATWTDETWRVFQDGMLAFARMNVREVVAKAGLPRHARRLLDLGGGHGLYATELVRARSSLSAVVFDKAEAEPSARRTIDGAALADRVEFRAGDFWHDDVGSEYDGVVLANVLHGYHANENRKLFEIVAGALGHGGRVVVLDQLPGRRRGALGPALGSLMAINMFLSAEAQTYPVSDIIGWMTDAGFIKPRVKRLVRSPGLGLVSATLP